MFAYIKQNNSAIVNPVFSKCGKGFNCILKGFICILKNQTEKWKCPKLLHKKPILQTYLKGGKIAGHAPKSPPN